MNTSDGSTSKLKKPLIGVAIALVVIVIIVVILIIIVFLIKKFMPKTGTFAGFRGMSPYMNVDPLVKFYFENRELRKKVDMGTIQIDETYLVYKSFINSPGLQNVPIDILREATTLVAFMESGREFSSPETPDFKPLGMGIINMDRLLVTYLDSLKISKNKVGGTDSSQEKVFHDYMRVNSIGTGYLEGALSAIDVDGFYGSDVRSANTMKEQMTEEIGIQLQYGNADPIRYEQDAHEYENSLADHMGKSGTVKPPNFGKIDRRFPGTSERRQIRDEPTYPVEKNFKAPNVPRPGMIGRVSDNPYHYDTHAHNYVRTG